MLNRYFRWIVLFALLVSLGFGVALSVYRHAPAAEFSSLELLPEPKSLEAVNLIDENSLKIKRDNFKGHWSLVYFGYSSCPDLCPLELQKLGSMYHQLNLQQQKQLLLYFVSLDPERDTPKKLSHYTPFFSKRLMGITGSNHDLADFARQFSVSYQRTVIIDDKLFQVPAGFNMPEGSGDVYQVNHSSRIYVINPKAEYVGSFPSPHITENMVRDVQVLMDL